jgi:single-strand DNA-binding protein
MLNQTVITGNLGDDPKEFFSPEGATVTSFDLAFQAAKKKTCWIRVVTFNKLAEISAKYLHKGARIAISGTLDQNKWTDKEGNNHTTFQILGNSMEFIKTDGRGFNKETEGEENTDPVTDDVPF